MTNIPGGNNGAGGKEPGQITNSRTNDIALGVLAALFFPTVTGIVFTFLTNAWHLLKPGDWRVPTWTSLASLAIPGLLIHFFNRRHPAFAKGFRITLAVMVVGLILVCLGILAVCSIALSQKK